MMAKLYTYIKIFFIYIYKQVPPRIVILVIHGSATHAAFYFRNVSHFRLYDGLRIFMIIEGQIIPRNEYDII